MTWFIRKPLSFLGGLFRVNVSKSGAGVSVGAKGLRVGVKPDGHAYVAGGREGLYFRESLGRDGEHGAAAHHAPVTPAPVERTEFTPVERDEFAQYLAAPIVGRERFHDPAAHEAAEIVKAAPHVIPSKLAVFNLLFEKFDHHVDDQRPGVYRSMLLAEILLARAEHLPHSDPMYVKLYPVLLAERFAVESGRPASMPKVVRDGLLIAVNGDEGAAYPAELKAAKILLESRRAGEVRS